MTEGRREAITSLSLSSSASASSLLSLLSSLSPLYLSLSSLSPLSLLSPPYLSLSSFLGVVTYPGGELVCGPSLVVDRILKMCSVRSLISSLVRVFFFSSMGFYCDGMGVYSDVISSFYRRCFHFVQILCALDHSSLHYQSDSIAYHRKSASFRSDSSLTAVCRSGLLGIGSRSKPSHSGGKGSDQPAPPGAQVRSARLRMPQVRIFIFSATTLRRLFSRVTDGRVPSSQFCPRRASFDKGLLTSRNGARGERERER